MMYLNIVKHQLSIYLLVGYQNIFLLSKIQSKAKDEYDFFYFILRYSHAEKIWNFLRNDRSNKLVSENEFHSTSSFGPIPLFKWPDQSEEIKLLNENVKICFLKDQFDDQDDNMTKNSKRGETTTNLTIPKDPIRIKSGNSKENRIGKIDLLSNLINIISSW